MAVLEAVVLFLGGLACPCSGAAAQFESAGLTIATALQFADPAAVVYDLGFQDGESGDAGESIAAPQAPAELPLDPSLDLRPRGEAPLHPESPPVLPTLEESWSKTLTRDIPFGLGRVIFEDVGAVLFTADMKVNFGSVAPMLVAGLGSYALRRSGLDDDLVRDADDDPIFNDTWGDTFDVLGSTGTIVLAGAWYGWSVFTADEEQYRNSTTLLCALATTAVYSELLKQIFDDERPQGGGRGWPSGHVSQVVAAAATLEEMVGLEAALPFYALSVVVGVQRIDERDHFASQVISGWVLGYVVGKTVAGRRRLEVAGFSVEPCVDPGSGLVGFGLSREF